MADFILCALGATALTGVSLAAAAAWDAIFTADHEEEQKIKGD